MAGERTGNTLRPRASRNCTLQSKTFLALDKEGQKGRSYSGRNNINACIAPANCGPSHKQHLLRFCPGLVAVSVVVGVLQSNEMALTIQSEQCRRRMVFCLIKMLLKGKVEKNCSTRRIMLFSREWTMRKGPKSMFSSRLDFDIAPSILVVLGRQVHFEDALISNQQLRLCWQTNLTDVAVIFTKQWTRLHFLLV
jgi:hypothetical protein